MNLELHNILKTNQWNTVLCDKPPNSGTFEKSVSDLIRAFCPFSAEIIYNHIYFFSAGHGLDIEGKTDYGCSWTSSTHSVFTKRTKR